MRWIGFGVCLSLGVLLMGAVYSQPLAPHAVLIEISGPIGPATSAYFLKAQQQAVESGARLIVLRMDTPGGLDTAMRDIIKAILGSPVPVAGYVAPGGARAASAGTYILLACHVAAMAPATNLGAATPVPIGGSWPVPRKLKEEKDKAEEGGKAESVPPEDALERKVVNDAVAYIRSLVEQRGRNADWAEKAVREAASLSAEKALQEQVIDLVAADVPELLRKLDGRKLRTSAGEVTLSTAHLVLQTVRPGWRFELLSILTNPTVAYVLLLAGLYGLLLEGYHPGAILPGVAGAICLLLAMYSFQLLPVNYAGLGLILLGVALMVAEAFATSFGVLGIGGVTAFVFGSIMLMDVDVPGYRINLGIIAGIAVSAAAILALTLYLLWRARHTPVVTGVGNLIGQKAEVFEARGNEGWAYVAGERWRVRSTQDLRRGDRLRVVRVDGLTLTVEAISEKEN